MTEYHHWINGQAYHLFTIYAEIKRGVRQGCILSPSLFNLYTECIFKIIEGMPGINISGNIVNNLRYADDSVLIADNEQDLQNIVDTIHRQSKEFGLDMNVKKTKTMVISRKAEIPRVSITVNNILEQVKEFTYLGQNLYEDGKNSGEVRRRIGMAKTKFTQMRKVFTSRKISLATKLRLVKCYVYSSLLYCCETWTLYLNLYYKKETGLLWISVCVCQSVRLDFSALKEISRNLGNHWCSQFFCEIWTYPNSFSYW